MGERHARTTKAATQGVSGELGLLPALGLETRKLRHKHLLLVAIGMSLPPKSRLKPLMSW